MNSKLKAISVALATLLATTGAFAAPPPPGPQPVTVTNTTANPVPTVATGTQTVTGSVSVSNTPSVNIANTPTVNVGNSPLPSQLINTFNSGVGQTCAGVSIPAGMVLIVKRVSVSAAIATAGDFGNIELETPNGGVVAIHRITFDANGLASYDFDFPAGLVAFGDPQHTVCSFVLANSNPQAAHYLIVNGYLANDQ
jgi:hypothetical protein